MTDRSDEKQGGIPTFPVGDAGEHGPPPVQAGYARHQHRHRLEELRAANQRLEQANQELENLLASTGIALLALDEGLRIQRFSPAATDIYNLLPGDRGRPIDHITHRVMTMPPLPGADELGAAPGPIEHEVQTIEGRWYLRRVLPYRRGKERGGGMVVTFLDVTDLRTQGAALASSIDTVVQENSERKRVEMALRKSEERFRVALSNTPMSVYQCDRELRYTWQANAHPDWPPERTIGRRDDELLPPRQAAMLMAIKQRVLDTGVGTRQEISLETSLGRQTWDVTIEPLRDAAGELVGLTVATLEISQRKRVEERIQRVFEQAAVGIALITEDGALLQVNRRLGEILGYRRDELREKSLGDITHAGDLDVVRERFQDMLAGRLDMFMGETRHVRRDGSLVWGHLSVSLVTPSPAEHTFIAVIEDITARKRYEQAIEEAARHKDAFLATLGHELRNPLAAIRNAVELQKMLDVGHSHLAKARDVIERQAAHMARLIDDLLDISRIARGKIQLKKLPLDLADLVATVVADHHDGIAGTGLDLRLAISSGPIWVMGDPTRLAQVMGNLLDNAAKFTEAPGTISVRVAQSGSAAEIEVRDTGIGIHPAMLDKIFDVFQQVQDASDRGAGGLGLGLSLVRGLVALHAGTVEASSQGPGTGACFLVRLPASSPANRHPVLGTPAPTGSAKARCILVVDDNHDSAELLRDLLQMAGHRVAVAYDGEEALATARRFRPDAVICDIGLPGDMSGYDVAQALRGDGDLHAVHLIAVTGYGRSEDRESAFAAGFDHHLTKPISLEHLQDVLGQGTQDEPPRR